MTSTATAPTWATAYTLRALTDLPADITTATPPQVDEVKRTVELDIARQMDSLGRNTLRLYRECRYEQIDSGRRDRGRIVWEWPVPVAGMLEHAAIIAAGGTEHRTWTVSAVAELLTERGQIQDNIATAKALVGTCNAEYNRRGGWTRFYRVANDNGHVHVDTACRTTFASTGWNWPTQLSGSDAQGVVEAAGSLTCLVCFPEVREEILTRRPVRFDMFETAEQRDNRIEREQAAKARNAAKIAKGVTVDGSPLMVHEPGRNPGANYEIKTLRAAELRYVEWASDAMFYARSLAKAPAHSNAPRWTADLVEHAGSAAEVLAGLAAKREETLGETYAHYAAKVTKKGDERIRRGW